MVVMAMAMEDLMEGMGDTEAMVVMVMEREMLSQDMVMEVMDMEDHMEAMVVTEAMVVMEDLMEVMVDTEVMGMVVMVMESNLFLNGTPLIKLFLTEQKMINSILDFQ